MMLVVCFTIAARIGGILAVVLSIDKTLILANRRIVTIPSHLKKRFFCCFGCLPIKAASHSANFEHPKDRKLIGNEKMIFVVLPSSSQERESPLEDVSETVFSFQRSGEN